MKTISKMADPLKLYGYFMNGNDIDYYAYIKNFEITKTSLIDICNIIEDHLLFNNPSMCDLWMNMRECFCEKFLNSQKITSYKNYYDK